MIQKLRQQRIVVLTTHSMEEADVLGDTIAIMAAGRLKAHGSSLFLKARYGRGYQIQLITQPEVPSRCCTSPAPTCIVAPSIASLRLERFCVARLAA